MTILWYLDDVFMILLSDLWYFYDTSCKIIQNVPFFYPIIYQLFISTFCQKMILWYFFHKKLFTYEHILNGKSKKYLIWNLIDTSFASKPHTPWTNGHRRVAELKIAGRRVKQRQRACCFKELLPLQGVLPAFSLRLACVLLLLFPSAEEIKLLKAEM